MGNPNGALRDACVLNDRLPIVSVPPWNQISIRQQAINRAWDLPKKLFADGTLTFGP